jgi:AGZA family xanthine/uracil permease-like MFS transporter
LNLEVSSMPTKEAFLESMKVALALPVSAYPEIHEFFLIRWKMVLEYLPVIIPMGVFNLVGSLQNIESAEAAGDRFETGPALAVNGLGTIVAAGLGSCFPTTIYIGHVGWKRLGARTSYSWLNGIVISAICLLGLIKAISAIVPVESVAGILVWIAIVITAQAFQAVPRRHAPAVALGFIPAIAAWGWLIFKGGYMAAGGALAELEINPLFLERHFSGLIALDRGFILSSMGLAAIGVMMIERRFRAAAVWAWVLAGLSLIGFVHSWDVRSPADEFAYGVAAGWRFALAYLLWGWLLYGLHRRQARLALGVPTAAPALAQGEHGDAEEEEEIELWDESGNQPAPLPRGLGDTQKLQASGLLKDGRTEALSKLKRPPESQAPADERSPRRQDAN